MSGWGAEQTSGGGGWGFDANTGDSNNASGGDAFITGDLQDALPEEARAVPPALPFERREAPVQPWVNPSSYDYQGYENSDGEWDGNGRVYHWSGDQGDIGPEHPELELAIFGRPEDRQGAGIDFSK